MPYSSTGVSGSKLFARTSAGNTRYCSVVPEAHTGKSFRLKSWSSPRLAKKKPFAAQRSRGSETWRLSIPVERVRKSVPETSPPYGTIFWGKAQSLHCLASVYRLPVLGLFRFVNFQSVESASAGCSWGGSCRLGFLPVAPLPEACRFLWEKVCVSITDRELLRFLKGRCTS